MPSVYIAPATLYPQAVTNDDLWENGYSGYLATNPFAYVRLTTYATVLQVGYLSNVYPTFPEYSELNVRVDGADYAVVTPTAATAQTQFVTLPGGLRTVEIVNALQSIIGGVVLGTYVTSLAGDAAITLAPPTSSGRLVIYGDSIAVGANASVPSRDGWGILLRNLRGNVLFEAWGGRTLWEDTRTAGLRAAFVARLASYAPTELWFAIGTNDYGLNKWSAADFGTAYAATLDDLHTALPDAAIYCQTPITRTDSEAANSLGSTLPDYRTQIATAQSTRSAYAELVDGTAWTITLADGVHPTTAGMVQYYDAVVAVLGL